MRNVLIAAVVVSLMFCANAQAQSTAFSVTEQEAAEMEEQLARNRVRLTEFDLELRLLNLAQGAHNIEDWPDRLAEGVAICDFHERNADLFAQARDEVSDTERPESSFERYCPIIKRNAD